MGCGTSADHKDLSAELSHSMPTISVDYMLLRSEVDEDRAAPIVATIVPGTRVKSSRVAPRQGAVPRTVDLTARYPQLGDQTIRV